MAFDTWIHEHTDMSAFSMRVIFVLLFLVVRPSCRLFNQIYSIKIKEMKKIERKRESEKSF